MNDVTISKEEFRQLVGKLLRGKEEVVGVQRKDGKYDYGLLESPDELVLGYDVTVYPPGKYLTPYRESLIKFKVGARPDIEATVEDKPRIIIGVHPYDLHALELRDAVYSKTYLDPNYESRKANTAIIAVDCLNPSPCSFAKSMGTNTANKGFDLLLTDIGDRYAAAVGSERGQSLLGQARTSPAGRADLEKRDALRKASEAKYKVSLAMSPTEIPALLNANWEHPLWEEKGKECFSCGSCTQVCPTCVCFDVQDEMELNLVDGRRLRTRDSCMFIEFAKVATGENFRPTPTQRLRHRLHRKGKYMLEKYGLLGCVGCGRCSSVCLPNIASPADAYNALKGLKVVWKGVKVA